MVRPRLAHCAGSGARPHDNLSLPSGCAIIRPMESILPSDFVFSQSNLQTYSDCPRRFWLTYIQRLPWPAVEASPVQEYEYAMRLGEAFHRAVQRAEVGIAPELIAAQLKDPLDSWFAAYLRHRPSDLPKTVVEVESVLAIRLQMGSDGPLLRLMAKFDLLAVEPGQRAVIMDWKTSARRTEAHHLRRRLQSQVYPYLVVEASKLLPWGPLAPEQVEMRYWFTAAPEEPVILRYDASQHLANHELLQRLIAQILAAQDEGDFPKLPDTEANRARHCAYCAYRSRCDRGVVPGTLDETIDPEDLVHELSQDFDLRLDDVPEIAF